MKINKDDFGVETNSTGEVDFGIKNPAIIFDILCNRLYENPLKIVVQEYLANARDSHREAGCPDKQVMIICPTRLESTLKIRDFGVGLSPDRMKNVFIYLGESTKNDANDQNGGFGVGAKVAWAYTDSFNIHTVYNGIRYHYLAYIGEEGVGKLDLLLEDSTSDPNSTTIEVEIKKSDYQLVNKHIERITKFWKVKPFIKNGGVIGLVDESKYEEYTTLNDDITFVEIKYYNSHLSKGSINVTVDDIPYYNIQDKIDRVSKLFRLTNSAIFVHFKTGELDLAINRESLQYTDRTNAIILKKLHKLKDTLSVDIDNVLNKHTELKTMFTDQVLINKISMLGKHSTIFHGCPLDLQNINGKLEIVYEFDKKRVDIKRYDHDIYRKTLTIGNTSQKLKISEYNADKIYFNDKYTKAVKNIVLKEYLTRKKVRQRSMWIIMPTKEVKDTFGIDIINFDTLGIGTKLSTIYDTIVPPITKTDIIAYDGDGKVQVSPLNEDFDPVYVQYKYVYQNTYAATAYMRFIKAYNEVHDTNYKLYIVTHVNAQKLKKLKLFSCGVEWITNKKNETLWNSSRDIIKAHILKNIRTSSDLRTIFNFLTNHKLDDPAINDYIKHVSEGEDFYKNVNKDKLNLFRLSHDFSSSKHVSEIHLMQRFFDRKYKWRTSQEELFMKKYPLMGKLMSSVESTMVVDYVNAMYNTQRSVV